MKSTLLIFFTLLLACPMFGQDKKWEAGVEYGIGMAVEGNPLYIQDEEASIGSLSLGITAQYNINKFLSFKSGIIFENINESWSGPGYDAYVSEDINMKYIAAPLLAKVSFGKKVKFFINGGLCLNYLLEERKMYSYSFFKTRQDSNYSTNPTTQLERFNMGLSIGMGLDFVIKKKLILDLELRQTGGFTKDLTTMHSTDLLLGLRYKL